MSYVIVMMTASSKEEAARIVRALLEEKLIACANILDSVTSFFWWQNKIDQENEALVLMKSKQSLFKKISKRVKELHSYDVPEVLAVPVVDGSSDYLGWLEESLGSVK